MENDANMGLYGEQQFGAASGYKHVAGFFLGTGIGGALILDGRLYRGSSGAAGEFGHVFVDPLGPGCGCGNLGCLEALAGRLAVDVNPGPVINAAELNSYPFTFHGLWQFKHTAVPDIFHVLGRGHRKP